MRIRLCNIYVDQDKALQFYTEVLGFVKKQDADMGGYRWLTLVSPEDTGGTELVLEPDLNPVVKTFKEELYKQGVPYIAFEVDSVQEEYERLTALGVEFTGDPSSQNPITTAIFDDSCGNWVQIYQLTV